MRNSHNHHLGRLHRDETINFVEKMVKALRQKYKKIHIIIIFERTHRDETIIEFLLSRCTR
ncbi:hypothetical protein PsorP6_001540 [Peronosclerospora sorghi]|uniref:Uncharacterized protein n=1 Tax=Peronosclerospora sorghi TaxID=230839 RepID=A0ACC0WS08_9STRA|nr:hypothetical protein PsorP6_001540 [Peronosclerospora sorghi]